MKRPHTTRRDFLKKSAVAAASSFIPYFGWSRRTFAGALASDRPRIGCIGVGEQALLSDGPQHARFGDIVAVCDVDSRYADQAKNDPKIGKGKADDVDTHDFYRGVCEGKVANLSDDEMMVRHKVNFYRCIREGGLPVSDVFTHVQTMNTCHLCGIAAGLNRVVRWDPQAEKIVGDEQAARFFSRKQRTGFEIPRV